jgi:hypothetical protein
MKRSRLVVCLVSACISVGVLGLAAPPAHADVQCTGTIGAVVIMDNVNVPPNASCQLIGTTVIGNVIVNQNSQLTTDGANVANDILGEGAWRVRIFNTLVTNINLKKVAFQIIIGSDRTCKADPIVLGNIQLAENSAAIGICKMDIREDVQLTKNTGRILVTENIIGMDLQVAENTKLVQLRRNRVGMDMEVIKNTGTPVSVIVDTNTVVALLQCTDNNPPPIGWNNTAAMKEGQCAGF